MRHWIAVSALCIFALSIPAVASAIPAEKGALEQSVVFDASAVVGAGVGPTMPDFPQIPWIGDKCWLRGGTRCCFSPYYGAEVPCVCADIPGWGLIWVYA